MNLNNFKGTGTGQITNTQVKDWKRNLLVFLAPVGIMYLVSVVGLMSANNNMFDPRYFIPSAMVQGGIILYVLNGILDILRKFLSDNKK